MREYWRRVFDALAGKAPASLQSEDAHRDLEDVGLRARLSSLEMDLQEKDRTIQAMRYEFVTLQSSSACVTASPGQESVERVFKRLAGPMSNLSALAQLSEAGKDVSVADLVSLVCAVDKELARAGMERVGSTGEDVLFDAAVHQRMSGGPVHQRAPVRVRIPGYRIGGRVLIKAMVSSVEDHDG